MSYSLCIHVKPDESVVWLLEGHILFYNYPNSPINLALPGPQNAEIGYGP